MDKAYELDTHDEIEIAQQHEQYVQQISTDDQPRQISQLIQKVHELTRDLFIERKRNQQLQQQISHKDELLQTIGSKLTQQAQSFNQLANDVQQSISNSSSSSSIDGNRSVMSFAHPSHFTSAVNDIPLSTASFTHFESMLRATQEEIDRQNTAKPPINPHQQANQSQSSSINKQRNDVGSFYDNDGELTRRGRSAVGTVFAMFSKNGQSMSFDDLTRLYQTTRQSQHDSSSDAKDDDDDDLLWCVWQMHASTDDNGGEAFMSEDDLATLYVQEKEFDLDAAAAALNLHGH